MENIDDITLASFTLVPGVAFVLIGFIGFIQTAWDDLNQLYHRYPVGFSGWFWKMFRWWIFAFMIVGILLILIFYAFLTK